MVRYAKKNQHDDMEEMKTHRFQRRYRGHKFLAAMVSNRRQRRAGWGYAKRRTMLTD
jgi:hypothetical protein